MNKKQILFAVGGWVLSAVTFKTAMNIQSELQRSEAQLEIARRIIVEDRFAKIIDNFDL